MLSIEKLVDQFYEVSIIHCADALNTTFNLLEFDDYDEDDLFEIL